MRRRGCSSEKIAYQQFAFVGFGEFPIFTLPMTARSGSTVGGAHVKAGVVADRGGLRGGSVRGGTGGKGV
jgi:hypothetical protein